jgi:uncharacterized membrane protein YfcA
MVPLSSLGLAFYALVLIGAFAVRGAAGFGAVLIAVPMLALILPVPTAVSVASALTIVTSAQQISRDWTHIAWTPFFIVSSYTMIGIGLGFYFLSALNEEALRRGLGTFLIIYSIYTLWTRGVPPALPTRWHGPLAAIAGIFGGFFGALFGGGVGPIYVVYFNVLRMSREAFRVTVTMILLISVMARIAGYAGFGFYDRSTLVLVALGLPLVFIGSWLGDWLALRLDPRRFGSVVGALVLLSGVALILR